jgi:hypothetical protein
MLTIAYLANQLPSEVEPYIGDEIGELRRRGTVVISGSVRSPKDRTEMPDVILQPRRTPSARASDVAADKPMEVRSAAAHKNRLGQGINREANQSSPAHLSGDVLRGATARPQC